MRQSRGAAAELDGQASHQSDGLAPTSKRRMQRRSPKPADAELTLLELCVCPLSYLPRRSAELYGHLTRRTVVVGVQVAVHPVSASADSRPVVARLDLTAGRPLRLGDAILPPPVHLIAVVKRWRGSGREGRDRSIGWQLRTTLRPSGLRTFLRRVPQRVSSSWSSQNRVTGFRESPLRTETSQLDARRGVYRVTELG